MNRIYSSFSYCLNLYHNAAENLQNLAKAPSRLWEKTVAADKQKLTASVACAAGSVLLITYYRPDQMAISAASYLLHPVLYTAGAAALIICNAKGNGATTEKAIEEPVRKLVRGYAMGEDFLKGCLQKCRPAGESEQSISQGKFLFQKAQEFLASLPRETKNTATGAYTLFVDCGGEPAALLLGTVTGETVLFATDGDTLEEVILITSLAATAAAAHVIYNTALPPALPPAASLQSGESAPPAGLPENEGK